MPHPLRLPVPLPSSALRPLPPLSTASATSSAPPPIHLWLDDTRPMPAGFTHAVATAAEAIALLDTGTVIAISLDHDLGDEAVVGSGYLVACHIEQGAHEGTLSRLSWAIHSSNPVGRKRMEAALHSAERCWDAAASGNIPM